MARRQLVQPLARIPQIVFTCCLSLFACLSISYDAYGQSQSKPEAANSKEVEKPVGELRLEGQVTTTTGAGLADVDIHVYENEGDGTKGALIAKSATDDFGDFQIRTDDEIHGDVIIAITKATYATVEHQIHLGDDEFPPFLAESLTGNLLFSGKVVSAVDERPVSNADVTISSGYDEKQTITDAQGNFTVKGVSQGSAKIVVEADHFGRESINVEDVEKADKIQIVLKPERVISFSVVNDLDQPIAGATIELLDRPRNDFRTLVADEQGNATAHGLHFDANELALRLYHSDYVCDVELSRSITLPEKESTSSHRLVMNRAGKVEVLILDLDGKPIYGVRVLAGDNEQNSLPRDWTNDRGRCIVSGIPPGETAITANMAGYAPQLKTISVKAGETTSEKLTLGPPTTLSGTVKTESGEAVPGVEIIATTWRGYQTLGLRAFTDGNGKFDMPNAPRDEFEVIIVARGAIDNPITVKAGSAIPVELTIPEAPTTGFPRATSSPKIGEPVPDVTVTSMDGQAFDLREMKGKVIFIDFWATWCGPCVAELPELIKLHKKFGQRDDFVMISLSLDFDKATLLNFLKKKKEITWPQVYGEKSGAQEAATSFGAEALPATFIVDTEGNIAASWLRGSAIEEKLNELLKDVDSK